MHILALETNVETLRKSFVDAGDEHLMLVRYHPMRFWLAVAWELFLAAIITTIAVLTYEYTPLDLAWVMGGTAALLLLFVAWPMLKDYIDWQFDFIEVTRDKVVIVDQTSIYKSSIRQLTMENFASVTAETQFLNLFRFGKVQFNLKEGIGDAITMKFIPNSADVADRISDAITAFQRAKSEPRQSSLVSESLVAGPSSDERRVDQ